MPWSPTGLHLLIGCHASCQRLHPRLWSPLCWPHSRHGFQPQPSLHFKQTTKSLSQQLLQSTPAVSGNITPGPLRIQEMHVLSWGHKATAGLISRPWHKPPQTPVVWSKQWHQRWQMWWGNRRVTSITQMWWGNRRVASITQMWWGNRRVASITRGWFVKAVMTSQGIPSCHGHKYATPMLAVYEAVITVGGPNLCGARIRLPRNLHFKEWEAVIKSRCTYGGLLKVWFPCWMQGSSAEAGHWQPPIHAQTPVWCGCLHYGIGQRRGNAGQLHGTAFHPMVPDKWPLDT